jgi:hypothetical protein
MAGGFISARRNPRTSMRLYLLGGAQGNEKQKCKFKILNSKTGAALTRHQSVIHPQTTNEYLDSQLETGNSGFLPPAW